MHIINAPNIQETRKIIDKSAKEGKQIIVQGKDIGYNRQVLENKKTNALILSHIDKKDRLYQKDSGLNHVLCNIAKKNSITLIIDLKEFQIKDKKERGQILGRMIQNINLIKKFKNKTKLINFGEKEQARAFLISVGMPTDTTKKALE